MPDKYDPRILFSLAAPFSIQFALPNNVRWFPEKKVTTPFRIDSDKIRLHPDLSLTSITIILAATIKCYGDNDDYLC